MLLPIATIENLLATMFEEQNISFKKAGVYVYCV